ncbi:MAG: hypothetical protein HWN80_13570 [Candidatus Lokiarchaeota archaeon]|nr:hypothetical protein [Candidatus Lokiarchaeota archaeon]
MNITNICKFSGRPKKVKCMDFHTFYPISAMLIKITLEERFSKELFKLGYEIAKEFP